ncbi:dual specificity tyrosine-phosphorylation-regulated kinase 2-like [Sycon ciliatum]|uniref:dual specificity tyrosine-phosphorylation-regulated kinase 2-like n=1 Tax=Sycon ciliatum TaxID=27933 RepID=UPI0020ACB33F|eukprot:scpid44557/ scgid33682/ Dual specificity tyrosine-phosphorylation-regulated kinase mbk-2; Dual specificity Yak1-related kinase mbk-2; Minibrain Kinase 2
MSQSGAQRRTSDVLKLADVALGDEGHTPAAIQEHIGHCLGTYERDEISKYTGIYFVGLSAPKIEPSSTKGEKNYSFDDEQNCYRVVVNDHIAYRFEVLSSLGKGSFGHVLKVYDHKLHKEVALKIVRNEPRFHRQAKEEVRILSTLRRLDRNDEFNVVHILEYFQFRSHFCITFELHDINLYELIKKHRFQGFSLEPVRKFAKGILSCLVLLESNRIIHCDLKPENILQRRPGRTAIKVIDFGSSCYDDQIRYTYIQSRFYRAPEVILGIKYGMPIDIWSFGCVLAELYTGRPLLPGEDEADQMALMMELLDVPPDDVMQEGKRKKYFFEDQTNLPKYCAKRDSSTGSVKLLPGKSKRGKTRGVPGSKTLSAALLGCQDAEFLDLLSKCLKWRAEDRITASQAYCHPWIGGALRVVHRRTLKEVSDKPADVVKDNNPNSGKRHRSQDKPADVVKENNPNSGKHHRSSSHNRHNSSNTVNNIISKSKRKHRHLGSKKSKTSHIVLPVTSLKANDIQVKNKKSDLLDIPGKKSKRRRSITLPSLTETDLMKVDSQKLKQLLMQEDQEKRALRTNNANLPKPIPMMVYSEVTV